MPPSITFDSLLIQSIPTLLCLPQQAQPAPLVICIPGYGGSKTSLLPLMHDLSQKGLAALSFDPLYHAERADPRLWESAHPPYGGVYPPETGLDTFLTFLRVIRQSAADSSTLLDHFLTDPRLDLTRAGVCGHSMGAYASFLAFAADPRFQAAVPAQGIACFTRRWLDLLDECSFSNPEWAAALAKVQPQTDARTDEIRSFDPAERLLLAAPRALLMMSGDFDTDQPKHYCLELTRTLKPAYAACPHRLRWNVYPAAHTFTDQMQTDAADWFAAALALPEN